jgi:hypothetical protein
MTCRSVESSTRRDSPPHLTRDESFGERRMTCARRVAGGLVALLFALSAAQARPPSACPSDVDPKASTPLADQTAQANCSPKTSHGFPIPDAACTPGAINPTVTLAVLKGGEFKTGCERNKASSAAKKNTTYDEYNIAHPEDNKGQNQSCELDHLVSLELGGADTLDNIWPQCGPDGVALAQRFFKIKDSVENFLAAQVRAGQIDLAEAQRGIAQDWTQYIDAAKAFWSTHAAGGFGRDAGDD